MNATQIKRVIETLEAGSIEDLILCKAGLQDLDKGYQEVGVETPDWIIDGINTVSKEITDRNRAELGKRLKTAKARREALSSIDEKRKKLDDEIAALEGKLK